MSMTKKDESEDLGIKIGSKKEAWLTKLRDAIDEERLNCEYTADLNREILEIVDKKIGVEKENFK